MARFYKISQNNVPKDVPFAVRYNFEEGTISTEILDDIEKYANELGIEDPGELCQLISELVTVLSGADIVQSTPVNHGGGEEQVEERAEEMSPMERRRRYKNVLTQQPEKTDTSEVSDLEKKRREREQQQQQMLDNNMGV